MRSPFTQAGSENAENTSINTRIAGVKVRFFYARVNG